MCSTPHPNLVPKPLQPPCPAPQEPPSPAAPARLAMLSPPGVVCGTRSSTSDRDHRQVTRTSCGATARPSAGPSSGIQVTTRLSVSQPGKVTSANTGCPPQASGTPVRQQKVPGSTRRGPRAGVRQTRDAGEPDPAQRGSCGEQISAVNPILFDVNPNFSVRHR